MVVISVKGGLGNQLFQYALGYTLATRFKKNVRFDTSYYNIQESENATMRELLLPYFDIDNFEISFTNDAFNFTNIFVKIKRQFERMFFPYYKRSYIEDQSGIFDPNIFKIRNSTYLDGFWQSPKYFVEVGDGLRRQLVLKNKLSASAATFSDLIKKSHTSISLHVRRGDYLSKYSHIYHTQTNNYYSESINHILNNLGAENITVFIFSDDIEWCKANMQLSYNHVIIDDSSIGTHEEMVLMSQCDHNIIANSTFSWWAAWINNNPHKMIIAPKKWFTDPYKNVEYINSIYPSSWICL